MTARIAIIAVIVVALLAATVQLTSYALFGDVAAAPSVPAALRGDWAFAALHTLGLDRRRFVRRELALAALDRNDPERAIALLDDGDASDEANDLRGRAFALRGDRLTAVADFGRAGDVVRARTIIDALADAHDPRTALHYATVFDAATVGHDVPPAVIAQTEWREGVLEAYIGVIDPAHARTAFAAALQKYEAAAALDPTQEGYALAVGFAAIVTGDITRSQAAYGAVIARDPQSVDAYAGLAVARALGGACDGAVSAFDRARALAVEQHRELDLPRSGYSATALAALARCRAR